MIERDERLLEFAQGDEIRALQAVWSEGGIRAAARKLGKHHRWVQRRLAAVEGRAASKAYSPAHGLKTPYPEGFKVGKVTIQRGKDGEIERTWERMCEDAQRQREMLEAAIASLCEGVPRAEPREPEGEFDEHLAVGYPIGDPHFGEYIYGAEAGGEWDLEIAKRTHTKAMAALVGAAPRAERAVIVNLGDALHYDSLLPKTPRSGHILNSSGRYPEMGDVLIETMVTMINLALSKHRYVHVINVQGNHDETGAFWLPRVLAAHFSDEPRVTFDKAPGVFNYWRFGKVLVGAHHGHSAKPQALGPIMAADRSKDWGETVHRLWWTGHVHHESKKDWPGCTTESFNTLAPADAYAWNAGYRSKQTMKAVVLHREYGEVSRHIVHPDMLR